MKGPKVFHLNGFEPHHMTKKILAMANQDWETILHNQLETLNIVKYKPEPIKEDVEPSH